MTSLELYKFVQKNNLEYQWCEIEGQTDLILFVPIDDRLSDFTYILGNTILENREIKPVLKMNHLAFQMDDICSYFDISIHDVFDEKN